MAIKWDKELEQELKRTVDKFNRSVERANKNANREILKKRSIEDIENKFIKRSELKRELRQLNKISEKGALKTVQHGEMEMTKWESDYLKSGLAYAKSQRSRRFNQIDEREKKRKKEGFKTERWYTLEGERQALEKYDLDELTPEMYERLQASIGKETKRALFNQNFYDRFIERLVETQDVANVDPVLVKTLKKRLEKVDPNAFLEIYNEAPYFKAVMEYIETKGFRKQMYGYRGKKSQLAIEEDRFNEIMNDAISDLPRLIRKYG